VRSPTCAANTASATPASTSESEVRRDGSLEAKRVKALEDEDTRLKPLLADAAGLCLKLDAFDVRQNTFPDHAFNSVGCEA
jgi:hypothetical protein